MAETFAPLPQNTDLVSTARKITRDWVDFFVSILTRVEATPKELTAVRLDAQAASIATANLTAVLSAGSYRVSTYVVVTQAPTTSGDVTVTLSWTHGGVLRSVDLQTLTWTSGLINAVLGEVVMTVDADTSITYQTVYHSVGATPLKYALHFTVEQVVLI